MAEPEQWRPGSFTKNFSWGDEADGLLQLHELIRIGFNGTMEDVPRAVFRERVAHIRRPDFIAINFFLFNRPRAGVDFIIADELVFQALNFEHSKDFDHLALFAFNFSYAGTWHGAESYQRRPALWAHHYVKDRVAQVFNWNAKQVSANDIERFVRSDHRYTGQTARKLATNLNYLYRIGTLEQMSSGRIERWWINALFLALDRLIEDRSISGLETSTSNMGPRLDRSNFHFISGRRSVEKDLATKHLLRLYEECGGRSRFSEEEVQARQALRLPEIQRFIANQSTPIAALHPSNPRIVKSIPRACAMLARYAAGFINLELDDLENLDLAEFIRQQTAEALNQLRESGVKPVMTAEELMRLTRGK